MQRFIAAILTLSLLGCGEDSRLGPEDKVTVSGHAAHQDGRALASRTAVLIKEPDVGEVLTGLTAVVGSLGLACLGEETLEICKSARTATTNGSGDFSFELLGKDTQGSVGQASTFNLAVRAEAREGAVSGASRTERFTIQYARLETPDLTLWEPQLSASTDATEARVTFGALPAGATDTQITFLTAGARVWSGAYASGDAVDARLLEDAIGAVSITTTTTQTHGETTFVASNVSEAVPFAGRAGAPHSRNAACSAIGESGVEVAISPCALTDGNLVAPMVPPADTGCTSGEASCTSALANRQYTIDLGEARPASLLVVRGPLVDLIVEHSVDGAAWTGVTLEASAVALPDGASVRYLRARSKRDDTAVSPLTEISLW